MFYKTIEEFSDIVASFSVLEHKRYGSGMSFAAKIRFVNESVLHIRDYLFLDGRRKYSYHWQDVEGNLISRWDNSHHHKEVPTYPHHRHISGEITESHEWNIREILKVVSDRISAGKKKNDS
ncbi:MAG: DUF6516 family protein [Deltaproteobacteria bacterium]|nr:DUF6516 family protein [Deltaproteobacteria bacterium]